MKIDCGPTPKERKKIELRKRIDFLRRVHEGKKDKRVFAWFPVRVGSHDCRWWEWVMKRYSLDFSWLERFDRGIEDLYSANPSIHIIRWTDIRYTFEAID